MKPKKPEPIIFDIRKDIHPEKNLIFYTFNKYGLYAFELKDKPDVFQIAYVFTSYASPDDDCDVCIRTIMRDKNSYDTHYEIKIKSQNDFDKLNILFNIYYVDDNFIDWVHFKQIPIKFGEYEPGRDIPKDMELRVSKYNHYCISSDNFDNGCPYKVTNKITSEQFIGAFNENSGEKYELSFSTTVSEYRNISIEDIDKGIYEIKDMNDNVIPSSELTPIVGYNPFLPDYAESWNSEIDIPCILLDKKGNIKFAILCYITQNYILFNSENVCDDTKFFEISASDLRRNYSVYLAHEDALNKLFHVSGVFSNDLFKLDENDLCIERWMY